MARDEGEPLPDLDSETEETDSRPLPGAPPNLAPAVLAPVEAPAPAPEPPAPAEPTWEGPAVVQPHPSSAPQAEPPAAVAASVELTAVAREDFAEVIPDGEFEALAPAARLLFHLQYLSQLLFFWAPFCAAVALVGGWFWWVTGAAAAAGALFFLLFIRAVWLPALTFDRWGFHVSDHDLLIRRGLFVRTVTAIPLHRIQHVDTEQGPIEQWFGLAHLQVHTASGLGGDGIVPGLELERADRLRERLVVAARGDGGV